MREKVSTSQTSDVQLDLRPTMFLHFLLDKLDETSIASDFEFILDQAGVALAAKKWGGHASGANKQIGIWELARGKNV